MSVNLSVNQGSDSRVSQVNMSENLSVNQGSDSRVSQVNMSVNLSVNQGSENMIVIKLIPKSCESWFKTVCA